MGILSLFMENYGEILTILRLRYLIFPSDFLEISVSDSGLQFPFPDFPHVLNLVFLESSLQSCKQYHTRPSLPFCNVLNINKPSRSLGVRIQNTLSNYIILYFRKFCVTFVVLIDVL